MEWTKIPTNLLNFDDKEILALVKYQLVWALAEEEPNTKMLKRYLTKKQLAIACGHHADVSLIVRRDIESVQKKRTKDNLRYKLAHNTNAKISPSETVGGSVGGSVGVPLSQIREDKIRIKEIVKEKATNQHTTRFQKPTIAEIKAYCIEKGYAINAEYYYNYNEARGWMLGKNHMKNWKANLATWHTMGKKNNILPSEPVKTSADRDREYREGMEKLKKEFEEQYGHPF